MDKLNEYLWAGYYDGGWCIGSILSVALGIFAITFPFNILLFAVVYDAIMNARKKRLKVKRDARQLRQDTGVVFEEETTSQKYYNEIFN